MLFLIGCQTSFDKMDRPKKSLLAVVAILLFLSGCELVGVGVMAASGPHCGSFDFPAELENKELDVLDHRFDWDRLDGMLAVLEPYEESHGPDILFALGVLYIRKAVTLSDDPAYYQRGVRLLTWSALCGQSPAVLLLSGVYTEGLTGVEKDPELGACLKEVYDPEMYEREIIPGRVWACGLRVESVRQ